MSRSAAGGLPEDEAGCIHELDDRHDVVLVAFGGLVAWDLCGYGTDPSGADRPVAPFEFFNLVAGAPVGKVFVRDLDQAFYQQGVRGLGGSVAETCENLGRLIEGRARRVFVGQSAGGFGALLFGSMLEADEILVFAPQTFVNRWLRRRSGDDRWPEHIAAMYRSSGIQRRYLDVRKPLRRNRGRSAVHLYYGSHNRLDMVHCERLAGLPNVATHPVDSGSHAIARRLRDTGELQSIVLGSLGLTTG